MHEAHNTVILCVYVHMCISCILHMQLSDDDTEVRGRVTHVPVRFNALAFTSMNSPNSPMTVKGLPYKPRFTARFCRRLGLPVIYSRYKSVNLQELKLSSLQQDYYTRSVS